MEYRALISFNFQLKAFGLQMMHRVPGKPAIVHSIIVGKEGPGEYEFCIRLVYLLALPSISGSNRKT